LFDKDEWILIIWNEIVFFDWFFGSPAISDVFDPFGNTYWLLDVENASAWKSEKSSNGNSESAIAVAISSSCGIYKNDQHFNDMAKKLRV
jgi:hypothetical protein